MTLVILVKVVVILVTIMVIWWYDPYPDARAQLEGYRKKGAKIDAQCTMHMSVMMGMLAIFNFDWLTPRKKNNKNKKNRKKNKAKQNGQIRADTEVVSATLELKNGRFPPRKNKTVGKHEK